MVGSGWDATVARRRWRACLGGAPAAVVPVPPSSSDGYTPACPEPDLVGPSEIDAGDRKVKIVSALREPRVVVFQGLLSDAECDGIVEAAAKRLARSGRWPPTPGQRGQCPRTSDGMFFERCERADPPRRGPHRRLLRWPLDHGEGLQVLRYRPGAEYQPHYDFRPCPPPPRASQARRPSA